MINPQRIITQLGSSVILFWFTLSHDASSCCEQTGTDNVNNKLVNSGEQLMSWNIKVTSELVETKAELKKKESGVKCP